MTTEIRIPEPNEKQKLFLSDKHRHIAYGGARGGGKSWAVRTKSKLLVFNYPGIKILIIRKTYPELFNNHIVPLLSELPSDVAKYYKSEKYFKFINGSTINFGYCNNDGDVDRYQGAEYDVIFFDEATQLKEEWIKKINLAVRGTNGFPKRTYYTCNPGGVSHNYIKRLFIDRKYKDGENPEDYSFIKALVTDNKVLIKTQPEYMAELQGLSPKLREAWLYGSWDIFEGQFFEDFVDDEEHYIDRTYTHIIEPFEIPDGWTVYRSFDWGYHRPFSCGWWAVDYDGVAYRILELYGCKKDSPNEGVQWVPHEVFSKIHEIESEHRWLKGKNIVGVADPAIWDAETGESIADVASKYQVYFSRGDNRRLPGWLQVHYRLAFDKNGYPMMYVFKNCKDFIRTIPLLQYDEHKPEDLDTSAEDHIADEVRYFCMSRPIKPRKIYKDDYDNSPQATILDIKKEDLTPIHHRPRMEVIED